MYARFVLLPIGYVATKTRSNADVTTFLWKGSPAVICTADGGAARPKARPNRLPSMAAPSSPLSHLPRPYPPTIRLDLSLSVFVVRRGRRYAKSSRIRGNLWISDSFVKLPSGIKPLIFMQSHKYSVISRSNAAHYRGVSGGGAIFIPVPIPQI